MFFCWVLYAANWPHLGLLPTRAKRKSLGPGGLKGEVDGPRPLWMPDDGYKDWAK